MAQLVYIVVLNWNQCALTLECVRSLMAVGYPDCRVVVVDNASSDEAASRLREEFGDRIDLIVNHSNLGFTGGNNVGIRHALAHGADYVMLLNNDTIVHDPSLVSRLVAVMESDPSIGLASPTIRYADDPDLIWYAGSELSLWRGWRHRKRMPAIPEPTECGYASGCCVMARAELIRGIGMLAEDYFLTVEDVEWSLRARRAGWRVVYVPDARLLHKVSASSSDTVTQGVYSPTRVYYEHRNTVWLVRQYGNAVQRWVIWPALLATTWAYKAAAYVALRRWQKLRALVAAIKDALLQSPRPICAQTCCADTSPSRIV